MKLKLNDIVIIHPEPQYMYEESMHISKVEEMELADLSYVFQLILEKISPAMAKQILNEKGYFLPEQIKEAKGVKFSNKDQYISYVKSRGYTRFNLHEFLEKPHARLDEIEDVYIKIDMPKEIQEKLDAHIAEQKKAKQLKEEKKLKAKIERAKKILEEAQGKL